MRRHRAAHCSALLLARVTAASSAAEAEFPRSCPGYSIELPRDEGSHPQFRTEWWYLTGWVETEKRRAARFPGHVLPQSARRRRRQPVALRCAPGAVRARRRQRSARWALLRGEIRRARASVWRRPRRARSRSRSTIGRCARRASAISPWRRRASSRCDWNAVGTQPPLLNGKNGFSQKGPQPQFASYYYSLPQLQDQRPHRDRRSRASRARRRLVRPRMVERHVRRARTRLGLDRSESRRRRRADGSAHSRRCRRAALGRRDAARARPADRTYAPDEIAWSPLRRWRSPRTGVTYPVEWKIALGGRTITLRPLLDDQENDARASTGTLYWEGAVRAFDERGRRSAAAISS